MSKTNTTGAYLDEGFRQLDEELAEAMEVLAEAVPLPDELLAVLPWRPGGSATQLAPAHPSETAQLLSVAFELLNMVEERVAYRFRAWRRSQRGPASVRGLWPRVLSDLVQAGHSEDEVLEALRGTRVEPVLTAHPTEAKRPTVREKHLSLYRQLAEWETARPDPHRARRLRGTLRAELESLWLTGEIYIQRPSVTEELKNAVYYLREVFPDVVLRLDRSLELAWEDVGWSVEKLRERRAYPEIRFATWIGGDRDGHPLVTPEVTAQTLLELRQHAARLHRRWLRRAAEALTLAPPFAEASPDLVAATSDLARSFGDTGQRLIALNPHEPWRAYLYLLREKMGRTAAQGGYLHPDEYQSDLTLAHRSLADAGASRSAEEWISPLSRLAQVFGFHLAALDVRQNSTAYDEAAADLLATAGVPDGGSFADWPEQTRRELLAAELANPRPLLAHGQPLGDDATRAIGPLRVLAEHARQFGKEGLGQLIVSMTRQPSDLLLVHLFCREAGLARRGEGGRWRSDLPVTPLFETGDDLRAAESILSGYFGVLPPVTGQSQPAMVGYSDSNKDAGVFASQWEIHRAQERIVHACRSAGTIPQFFHGRGGTIGRGAGPTGWFLRALPPGSLHGPVRLTEQGEVLPRKYAHEGNAHYHLELLVAGVSGTAASAARQHPLGDLHRKALEMIAAASSSAYRSLLELPGFIDFHRTATPIDALEAGTFGSRPPRRTGSAGSSLRDLRAIPWVFSWTQSRFYLPGWFGVGSGLAGLEQAEPDAFRSLRNSIAEIPFLRYVLTNVESSLASADLGLMEDYATLCPDEALRNQVIGIIRHEFDLTCRQVRSFLGDDFAHRRARMFKTLSLREQPLRQLHLQQVSLLKEWREAGRPVDSGPGKFDRRFLAVQLTINAISSGLRETG